MSRPPQRREHGLLVDLRLSPPDKTHKRMSYLSVLVARLRTAGIEPGDSDELKLKKSLLLLAMGLTTAAPVLWLALYWLMGLNISASLPFYYQLVSLATLIYYLVSRNFGAFRLMQLCLLLFFPFVLQWSLGNFITASGVVLWALLAPVAAILLFSARESIPWFVAYAVLIAASAFFDYQLVETSARTAPIPPRASVIFFALNFVSVSAIVYFLLRYAAIERDRSKAKLEEAHRLLQAEQERSERLLLNILPGPVAERLKQDDGTIADGFADVTVMFADIVNFTTLAEGMSPNAIFAMLNKVFSSFMALEMRRVLANDLQINDHRLEIRMGIGTGPVVAGVVGKKKFIYDLWGDTVNIASRITSEGVPGMIQVDQTTYRRLRNRYEFEQPQTIYLKGKGDTVIYRLKGKKTAVSQPVQTVIG